MGYCFFLVNDKTFEAFDLDKNAGGFGRHVAEPFATRDTLLAAVSMMIADWNATHFAFSRSEHALMIRDRIWQWMQGAQASAIRFLGEDEYFDLPKVPPVTADRFHPTYVRGG